MNAYDILEFRRYLDEHDPENKEFRRITHEKYEWLEGYWRSRWRNNGFDTFCRRFGEYYWRYVSEIPVLAKQLGALGPIGDSTLDEYRPNEFVVKATILLCADEGTFVERFKAMMQMVRQIRNNLFHGRKMELIEREVYDRNKTLVRLAGEITTLLLDNLYSAEKSIGL